MRSCLIMLLAVLLAVLVALALAGCGQPYPGPPAHGPESPGSAVTPSQPAPVDTSATLSGSCVTGVENMTAAADGSASGQYGDFTTNTGVVSDIGGTSFPSDPAFQVTLANNGTVTADVDGMAVVFSDAGGAEMGSVQAQSDDSFIVPGQSLTWTYRDAITPAGTGTGSDGGQVSGIPAGAATCQLVTWYQP